MSMLHVAVTFSQPHLGFLSQRTTSSHANPFNVARISIALRRRTIFTTRDRDDISSIHPTYVSSIQFSVGGKHIFPMDKGWHHDVTLPSCTFHQEPSRALQHLCN